MERVGFFGMTRKVHALVKQKPPPKSRPTPPHSGQVSSPDRNGAGGYELGCTWKSRRMDEDAIQLYADYLQSYGGKMEEKAEQLTPEEIKAMMDCPEPANISQKDCFGWTLLHHAADSFPVETLRSLLLLHADPNSKNCLGRTPLHIAVMRDDFEAVNELLSYGANPNTGDLEGWTAVHFVVHNSSLKSLAALIRFAPDFQAMNRSGKTPKDYLRCDSLSRVIQQYELPTEGSENLSQDTIETTDLSLVDVHQMTKTDSLKRCTFTERRDPVTFVRAQRPNVESGAIVSPHPNSAYS